MSERQPLRSQLFLAACAAAAALALACGNKSDQSAATGENRPEAGSPRASTSSTEAKPIELTGCVQKSGGSYVLTQMNTQSPAGAPSARKDESSRPEREQMNSAQHAYRLTAASDTIDLAAMVGKQVKVTGKMTEQSDRAARDESKGGTSSVGTSGTQDKDKQKSGNREEIDTSDLAKVEATSIEKTADTCGATRQGRQ